VIGLVLSSSSSVASTLSLYLWMVTIVPVGLLLAPQDVRRDKRTIVAVAIGALLLLGVPAYAVVCNVCTVCNGDYWWLFAECWFL
jgi:hypothetical protein